MTTQNINHFFPDLSRTSESVRMYAARILGIESAEQIVPFLLDALESPDPQVRREAVRALGGRSKILQPWMVSPPRWATMTRKPGRLPPVP